MRYGGSGFLNLAMREIFLYADLTLKREEK
jgi:hypothetical protein